MLKILIGTEHFAAHCAVYHGAPGVPRGDIAGGLYPQSPNLAEAAKRYSPGELFLDPQTQDQDVGDASLGESQ
jgi:hypothetical protein